MKKKKWMYRRTAFRGALQEQGKVGPSLFHCAARRQAIGRVGDTDGVRCARKNRHNQFCPQLPGTRSRCRHDPEEDAPLPSIWHLHNAIRDASQMGVTNKKHELEWHKEFLFKMNTSHNYQAFRDEV